MSAPFAPFWKYTVPPETVPLLPNGVEPRRIMSAPLRWVKLLMRPPPASQMQPLSTETSSSTPPGPADMMT